MLVVSDSSPFIALINIASLDVLPIRFGRVTILPSVAADLRKSNKPAAVIHFITNPPAWLSTKQPKHVETIAKLHPGESEAISLARELHADLLLVDERRAFHAAVARGLNAAGTVRVLILAAQVGILDLEQAFNRLKKTDFWISHKLLDKELEQFRRDRSRNQQEQRQPQSPGESAPDAGQ
jgi:predicted nucleic acid-binding protein